MATVPYPILDNPTTVGDLYLRFGPVPLSRVRLLPDGRAATEEDVIVIHDREGRLFELVDGVLVEKAMGTWESYLAQRLGRLLGNYVEDRGLGFVLGADGMARLMPGLIRIPDVSFVSWEQLPVREVPDTPMLKLAPDLAVEVISPGNTRQEMEQKLSDYFAQGVRLVWYMYPKSREVHVFTSPEKCRVLQEADELTGDDVIPGFRLPLLTFFAQPSAPTSSA